MNKVIYILLINFIFSQALTDISFISSKSAGLAGATVSNSHSVEGAFYNPSGLAHLSTDFELIVGTTQLYGLDFLEHSYLSFAFSKGFAFTYQHLGTSIKGMSEDYGDYTSYGFANNKGYLSREKSITFSHGISLLNDRNSKISIGYNLNYFSVSQGRSAGPSGDGQNGFPEGEFSSYAIDLGLYASLRNKINFGAFVKNLNSSELSKGSSSVYLPRRLDLGISYHPFKNLVTTFAVERVLGYDESSFRFGVEYQFNNSFLFRSGIQINPNRLGVGCAYRFKMFEMSYSLLTHPVLAETNIFDFKVYFE